MRSSRRVVSIVFADLVGFTSLAERLDPEDVAAIQHAYFTRARESLVRHGGLVEKYIGDAVVGSFGVRRAAGDDATRAVRAALDIVAAVADLGGALGAEAALLEVRVGVNTGEVLITEDGSGGWQLTGDAVNVAARLQARAAPGSVLVGPETAFAVGTTMLLEPAGQLELKGRSRATDVWHVTGTRPAPDGVPAHAVGTTFGREAELGALMDAWTEAAESPVSWLVTSPPGAGKTRLVTELADRLGRQGAQVWTANAAQGVGYATVATLLRQSLGVPTAEPPMLGDEVAARLLRRGATPLRAGVAAEHVRALLSGTELDADPTDLFSSWLSTLEASPTPDGRPPVWIVEDLHLAGPELIEFLRLAVGGSAGTGRLLVMTSRPIAPLEHLRAEPAVRPMYLDPLTDQAADAMIRGLLGPGALPEQLVRTIAERSQGNPLFIEELLRAWIQAGVLEADGAGGWRFTGTESADRLPTTVQSVYLGQLDRLPDHSRRVIHSGSIPGYTFPSSALPVLEVSDAAAGLQLLTELGLLVGPHMADVDPESYTYRHGLLREVAYASLSRQDRARLHLRFARWVADQRNGPRAEEAIGRHLAAAHDNLPRLAVELEEGLTRDGLAEQASAHLERAADLHLTSAPARAAVLLQRALDLTADPVARVRRTVRLGDAQRRSGRLEDAMRTFSGVRVPSPARPERIGALLVDAALGYEDALFASRLPRHQWGPDGMRLLETALEATGPTDAYRRARVLAAKGRAELYGGADPDEGRATCAEAVRLATETGSAGALAYALLAARTGEMSPDHLADRRRALDRAAEAARLADDPESQLETARLQLVDALEAGDVAAADAARATAEQLIERLRRPLYFWYPPMWEAMRRRARTAAPRPRGPRASGGGAAPRAGTERPWPTG